MATYDVTIVGGGIVGLATAYALSTKSNVKITLLEAEKQLASHQTGNNSGVIHSGLYYKPGSLKARNCVEGREALYRFCVQNDIPYERCGKLVVATSEREQETLHTLKERGLANGLEGLKEVSGPELQDYEPHVTGLSGLYVPQTGIVDYSRVSDTFARLIRERGHTIQLETRFRSLAQSNRHLHIDTNRGTLQSRYFINCGGLQSDRIARASGVNPGLRIVPFRGEYYELKSQKHHLVKHLIYPVPDPAFPFLGVHFTRMINGGVEAGPNAVLAFKREGYSKWSFSLRDTLSTITYGGFWRLALRYATMGAGEFYRSFSKHAFVRALQKLIPEIRPEDIEPGGAGVRAQALEANGNLVDDFRIVEGPGMIHVLNAPSPAATASISIGRKIAAMAEKRFGIA